MRENVTLIASIQYKLEFIFRRYRACKKRNTQRVVIIAGPYEARLDLARKNIARWCKQYKLGKWAWPVPYTIEEAHKEINLTNEDGFSDLVDALSYKSWALSKEGMEKLSVNTTVSEEERNTVDFFFGRI